MKPEDDTKRDYNFKDRFQAFDSQPKMFLNAPSLNSLHVALDKSIKYDNSQCSSNKNCTRPIIILS